MTASTSTIKRIKIIDNTVTLMCPECIRAKTIDVSKQLFQPYPITINAKCPCGHTFTSQLEKRRFTRVEITLPGMYVRRSNGEEITRDVIILKNLSLGGVGFQNDAQSISRGENLLIVFNLNDSKQSLIKAGIVVKSVDQNYVGAKFNSNKQRDILKSYLQFSMSKNGTISRLPEISEEIGIPLL